MLFNMKLKTLEPELYTKVVSWFYALIKVHEIVNKSSGSQFPYGPNVKCTGKDEYFCSYNIAKISSVKLQGVLVGYMLDCIGSM